MIHNIPDITMTGAALPLATSRVSCDWVLVTAPSTNTGDLRVGDSTTGTTSGAVAPKGTALLLPAIADNSYLDLSQVYVLGTAGDKAGILYGRN